MAKNKKSKADKGPKKYALAFLYPEDLMTLKGARKAVLDELSNGGEESACVVEVIEKGETSARLVPFNG